MTLAHQNCKLFLDEKIRLYHQPFFIANDPISIPHQFSKPQDIEISGFFAAILAWGNRTTIINSCKKLLKLMDDSPHQFITQHQPQDLKPFLSFVHRTFNATDLLYFIFVLQQHYLQHDSLEPAFGPFDKTSWNVKQNLIQFHHYFFSFEHPQRTLKHIATPQRKSACKRLNMFLRWMVRNDEKGVDFGLWRNIKPDQLVVPLDVHVATVAHRLGLIPSEKSNWDNAEQLTNLLKTWNPNDPCIYDFALFSLGVEERF